jgi:sugar phosphate isomerase/epimerase
MSLPASRLHISQISTRNLTLEQDVACYRRHGLGIELWESKFDDDHLPSQIAWLASQGIPISSFQPRIMTVYPSLSVTEPTDPHERVALLLRAIDRFAPLLDGAVIPTQTGASPDGNEAAVWAASVEAYKRIADHAARHNIRIALEPLGASLMNRSTIIPNIEIALQMLHEVNHPNLGLCADSYNLWESSALDQVSLAGDRLFLVHLADWRRPRNFHDRWIPGEGLIPLSGFLRHVQALGYQGDYVIELFSDGVPDSLWDQDPDDIVRRCRTGVESALASL